MALTLLLWIIVFFFAIAILISTTDQFLKAATKIGLMFGMPQFVIGISIVAFGTSLPELASSMIAYVDLHTEFIGGTVVGSNIANILLVIGITTIVTGKLVSGWDLIKEDIPILAAVTGLFILMSLDRKIVFIEAVILLLAYTFYIWYFLKNNTPKEDNVKRPQQELLPYIIVILSCAGIYVGAELTMRSVIALTELFHFPDTSILAASAVAIATSLPEMFVTLFAARKGQMELALGNIVGSNVFNICLVIGLPALAGTIIISPSVVTIGFPFLIVATVLYGVSCLDKVITKNLGVFYVLMYVLFLVTMFSSY